MYSALRYQNKRESATDYYPFGAPMPDRTYTVPDNSYRFGFNGKENDDEVKGFGNSVDFGARIYDPRVGRFLSIDYYFKDAPGISNYSFAVNCPILMIDKNGNFQFVYENLQGTTIDKATFETIVNNLNNYFNSPQGQDMLQAVMNESTLSKDEILDMTKPNQGLLFIYALRPLLHLILSVKIK